MIGRRLGALLLAFAVLAPGIARASLETDIVDRWYALLANANANALSGLLAPRARIVMDDLGLNQTKAEFLDSMAEWKDSIAGGTIRYRIESTAAGRASAIVCYHFKANDRMTRETFRFASGLITRSEQVKLAEDCKAF